jgi:uncharacterized protein YcgI (DUF1989 family)
MEHTRSGIKKLIPVVGESLLTNKRRPILTIVEDTCGVHDTLMSACDLYRYQARCPTGSLLLHTCRMFSLMLPALLASMHACMHCRVRAYILEGSLKEP